MRAAWHTPAERPPARRQTRSSWRCTDGRYKRCADTGSATARRAYRLSCRLRGGHPREPELTVAQVAHTKGDDLHLASRHRARPQEVEQPLELPGARGLDDDRDARILQGGGRGCATAGDA